MNGLIPLFRDLWLDDFDDFYKPKKHWFDGNIKKNKDHWSVAVDLPGIDEKDIKITAKQGYLEISGESKTENYERKYNKSYSLPENINIDKISAEYKNGVLIVKIPFEEKQVKRIEINASSKDNQD